MRCTCSAWSPSSARTASCSMSKRPAARRRAAPAPSGAAQRESRPASAAARFSPVMNARRSWITRFKFAPASASRAVARAGPFPAAAGSSRALGRWRRSPGCSCRAGRASIARVHRGFCALERARADRPARRARAASPSRARRRRAAACAGLIRREDGIDAVPDEHGQRIAVQLAIRIEALDPIFLAEGAEVAARQTAAGRSLAPASPVPARMRPSSRARPMTPCGPTSMSWYTSSSAGGDTATTTIPAKRFVAGSRIGRVIWIAHCSGDAAQHRLADMQLIRAARFLDLEMLPVGKTAGGRLRQPAVDQVAVGVRHRELDHLFLL